MFRTNQVRHYAELCGVKSILQTSPLKTGKGHLDLNNLKYDKTDILPQRLFQIKNFKNCWTDTLMTETK